MVRSGPRREKLSICARAQSLIREPKLGMRRVLKPTPRRTDNEVALIHFAAQVNFLYPLNLICLPHESSQSMQAFSNLCRTLVQMRKIHALPCRHTVWPEDGASVWIGKAMAEGLVSPALTELDSLRDFSRAPLFQAGVGGEEGGLFNEQNCTGQPYLCPLSPRPILWTYQPLSQLYNLDTCCFTCLEFLSPLQIPTHLSRLSLCPAIGDTFWLSEAEGVSCSLSSCVHHRTGHCSSINVFQMGPGHPAGLRKVCCMSGWIGQYSSMHLPISSLFQYFVPLERWVG